MDLSKLPRMSKTENPPPSGETSATGRSAAPDASALPSVTRRCPQCQAPLQTGAKFCDSCGLPLRSPPSEVGPGVAAEAWISVGIGILILLFFPTMMQFVSSKTLHTKFAPYPDGKDGWVDSAIMTDAHGATEVRPYVKTTPENSPNFWNDLSITTFAWALIIEGVALVLSRRPMVVLFALLVTVSATSLNLWYFVSTFNKYGLAPISGLAVIFGVYMCIFEFRLFQAVRGGTAGA